MSSFHLLEVSQYIWFFFALILGVTGCAAGQETLANVPTKTATISPTIAVEATQTKVVTPSLTPGLLPTTVILPTVTSIAPTSTSEYQAEEEVGWVDEELPTSTPGLPASTPTTTPAPTLSPDQEGDFLSSLMSSNGGCELPCWWGITPGQTGAQEARDLFASQGIDDWVVSFDGTYALMGLGYSRTDQSYYSDVNVQFGIEDNVIEYSSIDGSYRRELNSLLIRDWHAYSLAEVLDRYGMPPYVEFAEVENSPYYRLVLSYELLGIEITYIMPFEPLDDGKEKICFDLEHTDFISLILYPPGQASDILVSIIPNRLDNYISWEVTTGLDIEAFQQLFENGSNPPCVEVS